ncbi:hypothetical protein FSARC_8245 [Fusarium sarcochroum]|uniref:Heterokaryon incompatibility domain-containing protein n=1 Tax=Fusarium sarcochroum TaxID=1208366 RepID=A0A8H4TTM4_9HYPO|nr:hypothetical protein FSARC_8245 [Fusarium sarcochroum]
MYLINVLTLKLEEFYSNIPGYAILSHTWGDACDEVLFREMNSLSPEVKLKKGFKKIELCAKQAQIDGLEYCWVDTCCIDKSSSAELSEAINSMFSWYRNSAVCYIYLQEVDSTDVLDESFKSARWFSRGWTLQELIAPRDRQFFDKHWSWIGEISRNRHREHQINGFFRGATATTAEKSEAEKITKISSQVAEITGIPSAVFFMGDIWSFSAATRMSWAAWRETTRLEDQAYCLLGLFDVQMPLLYGESKNAFIRLQEEIIRKQPDHTLFAWRSRASSPAPTFSGLLAPSPRNFGGYYYQALTSKKVEMPYEMTNKGLHLQVRLIKSRNSPDEFYAILDVSHALHLSKDHWVAIKLARLDEWGQFARIDAANERLHYGPETLGPLSTKPTHVYIQHSIDHKSPVYVKQKPYKVVLGCATENMTLTILEVSGSKSWDGEAFAFFPSHDDAFYAKLIFKSSPRLRSLPTLTLGWIVRKDDIEGIRSHLAILAGQDDLYHSGTLWENAVRSGNVKIYPKTTFNINHGELIASIVLRDRMVV